MKIIVDRIEENYAIVELNGQTYNLPIELIPSVKEGDILKIEVLKEETEQRKEEIEKLLNTVFED